MNAMLRGKIVLVVEDDADVRKLLVRTFVKQGTGKARAVLISGYPAHAFPCQGEGAPFLQKPFTPAELLEAIEELFEEQTIIIGEKCSEWEENASSLGVCARLDCELNPETPHTAPADMRSAFSLGF